MSKASALKVGLVVASIVLFSGAFTNQLVFGPRFTLSPDPAARLVNNLIKLPLYLFSLVTLLRYAKTTAQMLSWQLPLTLLVLLAFVSVWWSVAPVQSLIDAASFALLVLTGMAVASRVTFAEFSRTTGHTLALVCMASIFYVLLVPSFGLMSTDNPNSALNGLPQGVFSHKNTLGEVSGIALLWGVTSAQSTKRTRFILILAAPTCLLLSDSATRLAAVMVSLLVLFVWRAVYTMFRTKGATLAILILLGVLGVIIVLPFYSARVLDALGRDATLTGRTYLWRHALYFFEQRPFFGYGAASIWESPLGAVAELPQFLAPHSHNSFLEVLLMFGMAGLAMAIMYLLTTTRLLISRTKTVSNNDSLAISFFVYSITCSMFEHVLFRGNSITFFIFVTMYIYLYMERISLHLEQRYGAP